MEDGAGAGAGCEARSTASRRRGAGAVTRHERGHLDGAAGVVAGRPSRSGAAARRAPAGLDPAAAEVVADLRSGEPPTSSRCSTTRRRTRSWWSWPASISAASCAGDEPPAGRRGRRRRARVDDRLGGSPSGLPAVVDDWVLSHGARLRRRGRRPPRRHPGLRTRPAHRTARGQSGRAAGRLRTTREVSGSPTCGGLGPCWPPPPDADYGAANGPAGRASGRQAGRAPGHRPTCCPPSRTGWTRTSPAFAPPASSGSAVRCSALRSPRPRRRRPSWMPSAPGDRRLPRRAVQHGRTGRPRGGARPGPHLRRRHRRRRPSGGSRPCSARSRPTRRSRSCSTAWTRSTSLPAVMEAMARFPRRAMRMLAEAASESGLRRQRPGACCGTTPSPIPTLAEQVRHELSPARRPGARRRPGSRRQGTGGAGRRAPADPRRRRRGRTAGAGRRRSW